MPKKLIATFALTLGLVLPFFFQTSPVSADGPLTDVTCPLPTGVEPVDLKFGDKSSDTLLQDFLTQVEVKKDEAAGSCGEPNPALDGLIEKRDCTRENLIITEVNELIGPEVQLDEKSRIINLYRGVCCLATETNANGELSCKSEATIYTPDYDSCAFGGADGNGVGAYCEQVQWIISTPGANVLKLYVKQLYLFGAGIIGFGVLFTMITSGIEISVSGSSGDISAATEKITKAILALVLLFGAGLLLNVINPNFFTGAIHLIPSAHALEIPKPDYLPGPPEEIAGSQAREFFLNQSIPQILNIVIGILGLAAFMALILAAVSMVTSYGNDDKLDRAKTNFRYALIGFILVILSYAVISIVVSVVLPQTEDIAAPTAWEMLIPNAQAVSSIDLPILLPGESTILNEDARVSLPSGDALTEVLPALISNVLFAFGFLTFVALSYGGMLMIFGRGDEESVTKARNIVIWAGVALALVTLGFGILYGIATVKVEENSQSDNDILFPEAPRNDDQLLP